MTPATFRTEWSLFRDHHVAEATSMADWQAAWRTWVGKWVKWGCKQHGAVNGHQARAGPSEKSDSNAVGQRILAELRASREQNSRPSPDWNGPEIFTAAAALPSR